MKTSFMGKILMVFALSFCFNANAQFFKKLAKKAERAAERTVERRVERESEKKTDQALDSVLGDGSGSKKAPRTPQENQGNLPSSTSGNQSSTGTSTEPSKGGPKTIEVYSKFDFVPGDRQLFFDNFQNDFVGDFPSKWNTDGSGEVVEISSESEKWFEIKPNSFYIPDVPSLPTDYTIEFDILANGLDNKTSSTAKLRFILDDSDKFGYGANAVYAYLPFCQYTPVGIGIWNNISGKNVIRNTVTADIRKDVLQKVHVSVAVNDKRFRLWVNENKYIDVPRLVPSGKIVSLKFEPVGFKDGKERLFISNLKVAEGGVDLRRKLISEGKISTNGILFESGSANIQPQSMGIIRQISQVLQQEKGMKLKIVGHTDSDGSDENNLNLSEKRAEAVKNVLATVYGISSNRLMSEGKGESEPVEDNATIEGKAQNRRVEFIKQ
ncbi:putative lipoprotein YiaD [Flagellimonas maritima]|uniref:Putative lipoprotein YiaD n=1 Tax=Flagellimonas maritima TaxID=1383885 RepID=A0A2Z4LQ81_9FLAO|nr:OmpA family protein [Allomuricauda aurantiaca]AWX43900.1 putative lipoprotein YiaD [Allomuricauda aurantiaca]